MKVTVLGCAGTYAGPGEACSGYLVQSGGTTVLVDAGPGTLAALQEHVPITELDAIFCSHSHPDHWVEIPVLRNALRYVVHHEGVPLYSTAETLELITSVCHERVPPTLDMHAIGDGAEVKVGEGDSALLVGAARTQHPPETLAFCLDDGRSRVAYSADTGQDWSFTSLGGPVDVGICEATFRAGTDVAHSGRDVHMTARRAGEMSREAGVGQLVITHLLPGADRDGARLEAEAAYGAPVQVATSGLTIET